jgi:hypothetical protein
VCVCVCVCMCVCVCACACGVRACVRACVCVMASREGALESNTLVEKLTCCSLAAVYTC